MLRRRALLGAVAVGALSLAGCGRVALGGPEPYTPPPPGIDDLYRADLLAALDRAAAGSRTVQADVAAAADPAVAVTLADLVRVLPVHRTALLTGAQIEAERDSAAEASEEPTASAPPPEAPTDAASLLATLVELRDLAADAARQVSGSLARPVAAIAARTAWSVLRLRDSVDDAEVPLSPAAEDLQPRREVPAADPPSIGAESDYRASIERAQRAQWYGGYLHEVLAARTEDEVREGHLDRAELHRARAEELSRIAEEDGAPVVARQAVYAIPGGTLDEETAAQLPTLLAQELLLDHLALVGAAPFERRPLPIAAALQEAETLAPLVDAMDELPGLVVEEEPAG
ncbi:DUF4439 domain-containing protein [Brachybacterium saurashtrense]|uniref:DUF4439 domain-containing protein n=2 Tax=Brachybacterium saurashtrense TaxID=556288 RepID=A0A345YT82_9MICO|nr:DUF4439 domain-containing protein [Brachybacterium saurashtrense]RRR23456.1 DUF4439 domain-containing protein [Brachybacterium saurashtrense]